MNEIRDIDIAEIFGYMLGDGWLSYIRGKYLTCGFSGDDESMYYAKRKLLDLFGDIGVARIDTRVTFSEKYNILGTTSKFTANKKVATEFQSYGMPIGKRVEKEYRLPNWVLNGDNNVKSMFLSGIYAAEGWIPDFQKSRKMLKTLGFSFFKRKSLGIYARDILINDFSKILNDLNIEFNVKIASKFTVADTWEVRFVFKNNHCNILKVLKILPLNFCRRKKIKFQNVLEYYKLKDSMYKYLEVAYEEAIYNRKDSARIIAKKYGLTQQQVEGWRRRQTGVKITANFPTYDQFLENNISDIMFTLNSVKQGNP